MSSAPFMQLYVGDYLADTLDLTTEEHGAYLLLLMTMWRHGASLPNDNAKLARIARLKPSRFAKVWAEISRFFVVTGDTITNKRLAKEHEKAREKSQVRASAGAKGGKAKALKDNEQRLANASVLPCHSSEPEPEYKKEDTYVSLSHGDLLHANPASEAVAEYNQAAERHGWPKVQKVTPSRRKSITGRLRDVGGIDGWRDAIERAEASDFLCGRTAKPWAGFGFDWLCKPGNFTKLMEGNYDNRTGKNARADNHGFDSDTLDAIAYAARTRPAQG